MTTATKIGGALGVLSIHASQGRQKPLPHLDAATVDGVWLAPSEFFEVTITVALGALVVVTGKVTMARRPEGRGYAPGSRAFPETWVSGELLDGLREIFQEEDEVGGSRFEHAIEAVAEAAEAHLRSLEK